MVDNYTEMIHLLEDVVKVNRSVTKQFIEKKTGLKIIEKGKDHGMIITEADKKVSLYLLDGGIKGINGVRMKYPGSFSEEDDSSQRLFSKEIYQIDPLDGTGDFVDTYQSAKVIGPTTLISKLKRNSLNNEYHPVSCIIFDILNESALISDGKEIGLYKINENGKIKEISYELKEYSPSLNDKLKLNRRVCYPQLTFDGSFMNFLIKNGLKIERTNVGGAGRCAFQFFRNYIEPKQIINGFSDLETISFLFNAQPDWKTWDTFPIEVIANALKLPPRTSIFGEKINQNPNNKELSDMIHTQGYILTPNHETWINLTKLAKEFQRKNPDSKLLEKNYEYKNAIFNLKDIVKTSEITKEKYFKRKHLEERFSSINQRNFGKKYIEDKIKHKINLQRGVKKFVKKFIGVNHFSKYFSDFIVRTEEEMKDIITNLNLVKDGESYKQVLDGLCKEGISYEGPIFGVLWHDYMKLEENKNSNGKKAYKLRVWGID